MTSPVRPGSADAGGSPAGASSSNPGGPEAAESPDGGGRLRRFAAWAARHYLILAVSVILVLILARTDDWLYRNEIFSWFSSGIEFDPTHPSIVKFYAAAVENCANVTDELPRVCHDYQHTYLDNMYFYRPIQGLFGQWLLDDYGARPWLRDLHNAGILSQVLGALLTVGLWLMFVAAMPPDVRRLVVSVTVLLLLLGHYRDEPSAILPDPFDAIGWGEAIALCLLAAGMVFGFQAARRYLLFGRANLVDRIREHRVRLAQVFLGALLVNFALPPIGAAVVQPVIFAAAVVAIWWLISARQLSPLMAGAVLAFLFIMISGDHQFLLRKLEVSRKQLYLVYGVYLAYAAIRPRGALIYLFPVLAVFHIPTAAMLAGMTLLAEAPLCLRRLRVTPLLLVSAATFALCFGYMQVAQSALGAQASLDVRHVTDLILHSPRLGPTALVAILMIALSWWPLLLDSDKWDHVARCGGLALIGLAAAFLGYAILDSEPELRLAPGYFQIAGLHTYVGPGLAFAVAIGLSLAVFQMCGGADPDKVGDKAGDPAGPFGAWRSIVPVLAIVLLLGVAKIDLAPRFLVIDAVRHTLWYAVLGQFHSDWCGPIERAAAFDDHYILSRDRPTNAAENTFSALKLKLRIARGVHDPDAMTIDVVGTKDKGC